MKTKNDTEMLSKKLLESKNIKAFIKAHQKDLNPSEFCHALYHLVEGQSLSLAEAMEQSHIAPSYGYQIFNGRRMPSRDKVIQFSIGLQVSLKEANRLLKLAEKSPLYVRSKRDAIFMFALNDGMDLMSTEALLLDSGCDPLLG